MSSKKGFSVWVCAGADPRMVRIGTGPPFWQINHVNSAYFRLFLGYFRVISAIRPPLLDLGPLFLHILDPPLVCVCVGCGCVWGGVVCVFVCFCFVCLFLFRFRYNIKYQRVSPKDHNLFLQPIDYIFVETSSSCCHVLNALSVVTADDTVSFGWRIHYKSICCFVYGTQKEIIMITIVRSELNYTVHIYFVTNHWSK